MRPGTNVTVQTQQPPLTPPVNTGTWFVAGITSQGPVTAQACTSFAQWQQLYGQRGSYPIMSDSVEVYFREGGSQVVTARVVGPSAVSATIAITGSGSAPSIQVTAIGPGAYANGYKVVVATASGGYTITIQDSNSNVLEQSNLLVTVADAVSYGQTSQYVIVAANGTVVPTPGTSTLTGGLDDITDIVTAQYTAALAQFSANFGVGQISCPGQTSSAIYTALANAATAYSSTPRIAYLDAPDTTVAATIEGDVAPVTALGAPARQCALFAPWADISPLQGQTGLRAIPPSAFAAGKAAQVDGNTGNPNQAAAGITYGLLSTQVDLHAYFIDSDRQALNTAGVNVIRQMRQGFVIYGNVTCVNRLTDPLYFMLSNSRLDMAIIAAAHNIAEEYEFSEIDGYGVDAANYGNELVNMLTGWQVLGALFVGANGTPAFTVDTSGDINTPLTASEGELLATIQTVRSPGAEQVNLNIVRVSAAQGL